MGGTATPTLPQSADDLGFVPVGQQSGNQAASSQDDGLGFTPVSSPVASTPDFSSGHLAEHVAPEAQPYAMPDGRLIDPTAHTGGMPNPHSIAPTQTGAGPDNASVGAAPPQTFMDRVKDYVADTTPGKNLHVFGQQLYGFLGGQPSAGTSDSDEYLQKTAAINSPYKPIAGVKQIGAGLSNVVTGAGLGGKSAMQLLQENPSMTPEDAVAESARQRAAGVSADKMAQGATQAMSGAMEVGKPAIVYGVAAAPIKAAIYYGAGILAGKGSAAVAKELGATPNEQEFFNTAGFFIPGTLTGLAGLKTASIPEGATVLDPVTGTEVPVKGGVAGGRGFAAGVARSDTGGYAGQVRVGPYSAAVKFGRNAPEAPGGPAQPAIEGNGAPPAENGAAIQQRAQSATVAETAAQAAAINLKAAQIVGLAPPPPPPPKPGEPGSKQVPPPAGISDGHISQQVMTDLSTAITQLPQEAQPKAVLEATGKLAKVMFDSKTVIGPDNKVVNVDSQKAAQTEAVNLVNAQVEKRQQESEAAAKVQQEQQDIQNKALEQQQKDAETAAAEREEARTAAESNEVQPLPDTPQMQTVRKVLNTLPADATKADVILAARKAAATVKLLLPYKLASQLADEHVATRAQQEDAAIQGITGQDANPDQHPVALAKLASDVKEGKTAFLHVQPTTKFKPAELSKENGFVSTVVKKAQDPTFNGQYFHPAAIKSKDVKLAASGEAPLAALRGVEAQWKQGVSSPVVSASPAPSAQPANSETKQPEPETGKPVAETKPVATGPEPGTFEHSRQLYKEAREAALARGIDPSTTEEWGTAIAEEEARILAERRDGKPEVAQIPAVEDKIAPTEPEQPEAKTEPPAKPVQMPKRPALKPGQKVTVKSPDGTQREAEVRFTNPGGKVILKGERRPVKVEDVSPAEKEIETHRAAHVPGAFAQLVTDHGKAVERLTGLLKDPKADPKELADAAAKVDEYAPEMEKETGNAGGPVYAADMGYTKPAAATQMQNKTPDELHRAATRRTLQQNVDAASHSVVAHNSQPIVEVNDDAMVMLDKAMNRSAFSNAQIFHGEGVDVLSATIRKIADRGLSPNVDNLRSLANAIDGARTPHEGVILLREGLSADEKSRAVAEEIFHDWQWSKGLTKGKNLATVSARMSASPVADLWKRAGDGLRSGFGYGESVIPVEIPAWLSAGRHEDIDLSPAQAAQVLSEYIKNTSDLTEENENDTERSGNSDRSSQGPSGTGVGGTNTNGSDSSNKGLQSQRSGKEEGGTFYSNPLDPALFKRYIGEPLMRMAEPLRLELAERGRIADQANNVHDMLQNLDRTNRATTLEAKGLIRSIKEAGFTNEDGAQVFRHLEDPAVPLNEKQIELRDEWIKPLNQVTRLQYVVTKLIESGKYPLEDILAGKVPQENIDKIVPDEANYQHRIPVERDTFVDKLLGDSLKRFRAPGSVLSRIFPSAKRSIFKEIHGPDGEREVVAVKNGRVTQFINADNQKILDDQIKAAQTKLDDYKAKEPADIQGHKDLQDKLEDLLGKKADLLKTGHTTVDLGQHIGGYISTTGLADEAVKPLETKLDAIKKEFSTLHGSQKRAVASAQRIENLYYKIDDLEKQISAVRASVGPEQAAQEGLTRAQAMQERIKPLQQQIDRLTERQAALTAKETHTRWTQRELKNIPGRIQDLRDRIDAIGDEMAGEGLQGKYWRDKNGNLWKFDRGTTEFISARTGQKYHADSRLAGIVNYMEVNKGMNAAVVLEHAKGLLESEGMALKTDNSRDVPEGWKPTSLMQMRGYYFPDHVADAFDQFDYLQKRGAPNVLEMANNAVVQLVLMNPIFHGLNIGSNWFSGKEGEALAGQGIRPSWYSDQVKAGIEAANMMKDWGGPEYQRLLRMGLDLRGADAGFDVRTKEILRSFTDQLEGQKPENAAMSALLGVKNAAQFMRAKNHEITFGMGDMALAQAFYAKRAELARGGMDTETAEEAARDWAHRMVGEYTTPVRLAGSANLARIAEKPWAMAFFRYRFGFILRPLASAIRESLGEFKPDEAQTEEQGEPTNEFGQNARQARTLAIARLAALVIMATYVFPKLLDEAAKKITNDERARFPRGALLKFASDAYETATGERSIGSLVGTIFSPSPGTAEGVQLALNRDEFSGRHIAGSDQTRAGQAKQVAQWLWKGTLPGQTSERADQSGLRQTVEALAGFKFPIEHGIKAAVEIRRDEGGSNPPDPAKTRVFQSIMAAADQSHRTQGGDTSLHDALLASGKLSISERKTLREAMREAPIVFATRGLEHPQDFYRVFQHSTDLEKAALLHDHETLHKLNQYQKELRSKGDTEQADKVLSEIRK